MNTLEKVLVVAVGVLIAALLFMTFQHNKEVKGLYEQRAALLQARNDTLIASIRRDITARKDTVRLHTERIYDYRKNAKEKIAVVVSSPTIDSLVVLYGMFRANTSH